MSDELQQNQTTEQAPAPAPQLQIADLLLTAQLIQLTTKRGAFNAEELSQVGGLYDRIVAFLQASGALKPAEEAGTPAETPAE
jgi:hypothetical protein